MTFFSLIQQAETRIRPFVRTTYLDYSHHYSQLGDANVYVKLENLQHTGSFKLRGALNKVLSLSETERAQGIITASTGNHGAAVSYALQQVGAAGTVFVPENAAPTKVDNIGRWGGTVRFYGDDGEVAERQARQVAAAQGQVYISPYNDWQVAAGQGTIGLELCQQMEPIDAVFVALGGGGLISGIGGAVKERYPQAQIIACSPENSQVMMQSLQAGEILERPSLPTLSDGTAGGVEAGSITFELCQQFIDQMVTVTEAEIAAELKTFMSTHHQMIEGAAAVALASYVKLKEQFVGQNVAIVICGGNISLDVLTQVLNSNSGAPAHEN